MRNRGALVGAVLAIVVGAGVVSAGIKASGEVMINTTYHYAYGVLGSARNSSDTVQQLVCNVYHQAGYEYAQCWAADRNGVYASCYTNDAGYISRIAGLNGDGYLRFDWDVNGYCSYMIVGMSSYGEPKKP